MASDIIAIVPARAGSKGIPEKNIKNLAGHPLLAYSIAAARLADIDQVIVSTDSKYYAEIAKRYGAEVPFIRPADISKDGSIDYKFMSHAMEWYKSNKGTIPKYWLHLRPTTPLRDPEVLKSAVNCIAKDSKATSLRSGHEVLQPRDLQWFWHSVRLQRGLGWRGLRELRS